jgi:hypothetical protein
MKTDAFFRLAIGGHLMPMDPLCNQYLDECTKQALNGELPPRAIDLKNKAEKILVVCARFKALLANNTKFTDELFNTLLDEVENADPTGAFASHQVNGRTVNEQRNNLFVDVIGLDGSFTDDFDEDDDDARMNVEYLEELHVYTGVRVDFAQYVSTYGDDLRLIVHIGDEVISLRKREMDFKRVWTGPEITTTPRLAVSGGHEEVGDVMDILRRAAIVSTLAPSSKPSDIEKQFLDRSVDIKEHAAANGLTRHIARLQFDNAVLCYADAESYNNIQNVLKRMGYAWVNVRTVMEQNDDSGDNDVTRYMILVPKDDVATLEILMNTNNVEGLHSFLAHRRVYKMDGSEYEGNYDFSGAVLTRVVPRIVPSIEFI